MEGGREGRKEGRDGGRGKEKGNTFHLGHFHVPNDFILMLQMN